MPPKEGFNMLNKNDFRISQNYGYVLYDCEGYYIVYRFEKCDFYASNGIDDGIFSSFDEALEWLNER